MDKYVLITGASEGIGMELARTFASRGHNLVLVARRKHILDSLAKELIQATAVKVIVKTCDLTSANSIIDLVHQVNSEKLRINILINNAGLGDFSLFSNSNPEKNKQLIDLNIQAVVSLTHSFLPGMIKNKEGVILNVASMAAFSPGPYLAVYAAAKAFILSFSNALLAELAEHNIRVSVLCPGDIKTGFQRNAGLEGYEVQSKISVKELAEFTYTRLMIEQDWEIIPEETKKTIEMLNRTGNRSLLSENFYKMRRQLSNKLVASK